MRSWRFRPQRADHRSTPHSGGTWNSSRPTDSSTSSSQSTRPSSCGPTSRSRSSGSCRKGSRTHASTRARGPHASRSGRAAVCASSPYATTASDSTRRRPIRARDSATCASGRRQSAEPSRYGPLRTPGRRSKSCCGPDRRSRRLSASARVRHPLAVSRASICLLGGFAATVDDAPVEPRAWRLRKGRELVKLLALAPGHRLHREQVMDVLWRDHAPAAAANNLYQAVHAARRALGPGAIAVHDEVVSLADDIEVDVDVFERAAADAERSGTTAAHRAALELYTGELLPENRYDDWAEATRERLEELHARLQSGLSRSEDTGGLRGLPAETSSFVGRGHELGELHALLR